MTTCKDSGEKQTQKVTTSSQATAIDILMNWLNENLPATTINAIGYRVVHGGPDHSQPELITDDFEQKLQSFASFDPEHAPATLEIIEEMRKRFPNTPHIACFDTAFFHNLPRVAQLLPLPRKYEAKGLRRYGFHGLSYAYLLSAFRAMADETEADGKIIFAHLGSGVSLAAVDNGKPIDTTMSFTPASGIIMSSRSGDLDPNIFGFLSQQTGMSLYEFNHMINFESGLLGVSELSADMYTLLQNEESNPKAAEAVELFVYQVVKSIGALTAALGGIDALVFSGGIGEQSSILRKRITEKLKFLGVKLNIEANDKHSEVISTHESQVGVYVIPTDEAKIITEQVIETLAKN